MYHNDNPIIEHNLSSSHEVEVSPERFICRQVQ